MSLYSPRVEQDTAPSWELDWLFGELEMALCELPLLLLIIRTSYHWVASYRHLWGNWLMIIQNCVQLYIYPFYFELENTYWQFEGRDLVQLILHQLIEEGYHLAPVGNLYLFINESYWISFEFYINFRKYWI